MKIADEDTWSDDSIRRFWDYYSAQPRNDATYFSKKVGRGISAYLQKAGVLNGRVLDYGCGLGFLCAELLNHEVSVAGCDWSEKTVAAANARLRGTTGWEGATVLGREPSELQPPYDLITCIETIEHVPTRAEKSFLSNLRSLLAEGGALFVTTPNDERLEDALVYCPFCDIKFHSMQHVRSFNKASLQALLETNGFVVERVDSLKFERLQGERRLPNPVDISLRHLAVLGVHAVRNVRRRMAGAPSQATAPHLCAIARRKD